VLKHTFTGSDASVVFQFQQLARDAQGRLVGAGLMSVPKSYRFDPATNTLSLFKAAVVDGVGTVALDARGTLFYQMMTGREVHMIAPDGTDTVVAGLTHLPITHGVTRGSDGRVYVTGATHGASLYQVKAGQETLYAGKESQTGQTGNPATATALKKPTGLAVATDGTLYVTDDGALLRFHATEATTALVAAGALTDGTLAVEPVRPQLGPDGYVYFIGRLPFGTRTAFQGVWRVKAGGTPERVHTSDRHVEDYLLEADGTLILAESTPPGTSGTTGRIVKRSATGTVETLVAEDQGLINSMALGKDAEGRLLLRGARKLGPTEFLFDRIFRVAGLEVLPTTTFWPEARNARGDEVSGWYVSTPAIPKTIRRHKPATGAIETLTGPEGRFFTGTGVDDGVDTPQQPAFDGQGNLFFLDSPNKQVKRIPASEL
jgi:streptogramin lyase